MTSMGCPEGFSKRRTAVLRRVAVLAVMSSCLPLGVAFGQRSESFTARLSPAPLIGVPRDNLVGIGSASASLSGTTLVIEGSFEQLASPATAARLHIGQLTGVRGEVLFDLEVARGAGPGTSGTITGSVELTAEQSEALRDGRLYIQLHSEGAPDGHLLGWLLEEDA